MDELLKTVRECKRLKALALHTNDDVNLARYEHSFWTLMHTHGAQILDILEEALTTDGTNKLSFIKRLSRLRIIKRRNRYVTIKRNT